MPAHQLGSLLFDQAPVGILLLGADGVVRACNAEAVRTLATPQEDLVGRPVLATLAHAERPRVRGLYLQVLKGRTREWTARFLRGDGVSRVQWTRAVPAVGQDGSVEHIVLYLRDVTREPGGRPDGGQLGRILENLPGRFCMTVDADGVVRFAGGLSRTHFIPDHEMVGRPVEELLAEEEAGAEELLQAAAAGESRVATVWQRRADGTVFPALVHVAPYRDVRHGGVLGTLWVGDDRSEAEEARVAAERSARHAAVGAWAVDFLSSLEEAVDRAAAELGAGDGQRASEHLGAMRDAIASVRTYGSLVVERGRRFSPAGVAQEALKRMRGRAAEAGVRPELAVDEALEEVRGDREALIGAVVELASNALDVLAGVEDPRLRVRVGAVGRRIHIHVEDNGSGPRADVAERMLEPFVSSRPGRAGLGLARVHAVAAAHGGGLDWRRTDGWTTFTLLLPAAGVAKPVRLEPLALDRSRSVLVVEDEAGLRSSIRRFLEALGFDVREAWSGRSAMAQVTVRESPDLVVTDLRMDEGSGYWFLEQLERDFPTLLRHTVIITGDTNHVEVERVARRTRCPVLEKPFELPELLEVLDEVSGSGVAS